MHVACEPPLYEQLPVEFINRRTMRQLQQHLHHRSHSTMCNGNCIDLLKQLIVRICVHAHDCRHSAAPCMCVGGINYLQSMPRVEQLLPLVVRHLQRVEQGAR